MKRAIATAVAFGLAIAVSACSGKNDPPRGRQGSSSSPTPGIFGPPNATLGNTGLIRELPDTCQAVKTSLPTGMSDTILANSFEAPIPNFQECRWSALGNSSARIFRYGFWQYDSGGQAHKVLNDLEHHSTFEDDDCRYTGATKNVPNLGEEAFSAPCTYRKYDSVTRPESEHVYEVGGANLVFRIRNVVIRLWWVTANYPASEAEKNPHWLRSGKTLPYEQALPQATQVAKAVLTHFPN
jgi:hypothetical protein